MSGRRTTNMSIIVNNNDVELNLGGSRHIINRPPSISTLEWEAFWEGADETNFNHSLPVKKKKK